VIDGEAIEIEPETEQDAAADEVVIEVTPEDDL
jgi:hypothetical protein